MLAVGILNLMKLPAIPGMERFAGHSFHAARWDYEYTGGGPGQPLTKLGHSKVALIGTGATGIQVLPPLAAAAEQVDVFQRTPSAIGVRGNRHTPAHFADGLSPGWQQARMDNFQAIMLGRSVDEDLTDDGWTHHYAPSHHPPRGEGMTRAELRLAGEELDFEIMEEHRQRVSDLVADQTTVEILKPWYRYLCKRPCFHDDYLQAFNEPNVTLVDCPGGIEEITERGPVVDGRLYPVDCIVYGTGFEAELTPLARRVGHDIVGRGGVSLAEKWDDGASSLFGMMSRGFPNMFVMPAPGQQAVVTVNYTQLAVFGADFIGRLVEILDRRAVRAFDVAPEAEESWVSGIVDAYVDGSAVMSACTPSRLNLEGNPGAMNPRNGNYGGGAGDFFAYRELLTKWLEAGDCDGLELEAGR